MFSHILLYLFRSTLRFRAHSPVCTMLHCRLHCLPCHGGGFITLAFQAGMPFWCLHFYPQLQALPVSPEPPPCFQIRRHRLCLFPRNPRHAFKSAVTGFACFPGSPAMLSNPPSQALPVSPEPPPCFQIRRHRLCLFPRNPRHAFKSAVTGFACFPATPAMLSNPPSQALPVSPEPPPCFQIRRHRLCLFPRNPRHATCDLN